MKKITTLKGGGGSLSSFRFSVDVMLFFNLKNGHLILCWFSRPLILKHAITKHLILSICFLFLFFSSAQPFASWAATPSTAAATNRVNAGTTTTNINVHFAWTWNFCYVSIFPRGGSLLLFFFIFFFRCVARGNAQHSETKHNKLCIQLFLCCDVIFSSSLILCISH